MHLHTDGEGSPARFYKDLAPLSRLLREQLVDVLLPSDATPTSSAPSHLGPAPIPSNPIEVPATHTKSMRAVARLFGVCIPPHDSYTRQCFCPLTLPPPPVPFSFSLEPRSPVVVPSMASPLSPACLCRTLAWGPSRSPVGWAAMAAGRGDSCQTSTETCRCGGPTRMVDRRCQRAVSLISGTSAVQAESIAFIRAVRGLWSVVCSRVVASWGQAVGTSWARATPSSAARVLRACSQGRAAMACLRHASTPTDRYVRSEVAWDSCCLGWPALWRRRCAFKCTTRR